MGRPRDLDERQLRRLAAEGWSSRDIGKKFGLTFQAVLLRCRRLGVTLAGRSSPRCSAKNRRNALRRHRQGKLLTRGEWNRWESARQAMRMGWPQVALVGEARVLQVLWEHGPMTRAEIAARLGMSIDARGQATYVCSRRVRSLREAGLTGVVGYQPVPRNRPRWVFGLCPGVAPRGGDASASAYPDAQARVRCAHGNWDGECPQCEKNQRNRMVIGEEAKEGGERRWTA